MELQHFSHEHPLLFNGELSHEKVANCAGCGELVSGPNFSCIGCKFYLDKQCAEAPSHMNHPFHPNHSFELLINNPYSGKCPCDFCRKPCENFVYHCSCDLDLHMKCALLSCKIADKKIAELQNIPRVDPLICTELRKAECFACWKPLLDFEFLSPDCGFYLHSKCLDLTVEIDHLFHPQHPLVLQFNSKRLPCNICKKSQWRGLVYSCSSCHFVLDIHCASLPTHKSQAYHRKHPLILKASDGTLPCQICQETHLKEAVYFCSICKFLVHSGCASPSSTIEDHKINHDHHFISVQANLSFICDACGTSGNYISYICQVCNFIVHKKCTSLPRVIKFFLHHHRLFHTYFLALEAETLECRYCREDVKTAHGSYSCSMCNFIVHVKCALKKSKFYREVDQTEEDEARDIPSYSRVSTTCIKHFSHDHNLSLSEDPKDEKQCDGCSSLISTPFFCCSQCDFFLHESCAELPLKKPIWFRYTRNVLVLASICIFKCSHCQWEKRGFAYVTDPRDRNYCIQCTSLSDIHKSEGHNHALHAYRDYECTCSACGAFTTTPSRCKTCNFNLCLQCQLLPLKVRHQSDDHLYTLTYHDKNNYSARDYCDICEEEKNPNHWFYCCSICDNSVHPYCVIGEYKYIKIGSIYSKGDHRHPLTFVQKVHYYQECHICGEPCFDLALECQKIGCNYIAHWECIKPHGT